MEPATALKAPERRPDSEAPQSGVRMQSVPRPSARPSTLRPPPPRRVASAPESAPLAKIASETKGVAGGGALVAGAKAPAAKPMKPTTKPPSVGPASAKPTVTAAASPSSIPAPRESVRAAVRPRAPRSIPRPVSTFVTALSDTTEQPVATEVEAELIEEVATAPSIADTLRPEAALVAPPSIDTVTSESAVTNRAPAEPEVVAAPSSTPLELDAETLALAAHPALPPPPPVPSSLGLKVDNRPKLVAPPRTFTTTASDWPIAQVPSAPTLLLPEFGDRPHGAPDPTRFSLPAFLPPPGMLLEPSNGNAIIETSRAPEQSDVHVHGSVVDAPREAPSALSFIAPVASKPASNDDAGIVFVAPLGEDVASADLAAPMDAAFAAFDEQQPAAQTRLFPQALVDRLPRWACFAAGIGLGVVVTLLAT